MYTAQLMQERVASIDGWLSRREARLLYEFGKRVRAEGEVVEIGSWKGKSTVALAYGIKAGGHKRRIAAIDPHEGVVLPGQRKGKISTLADFRTNVRTASVADIIKPVVSSSAQAARSWREPIAILFIDGIHDYQHAGEDYRLWSGCVSRHGVIAFHDCFCGVPGVMRAAREYMLKADEILDVGTVGSILYGIRGEARGFARLRLWGKIVLINIAQGLYESKKIPQWLQNILIHRLVRIWLLTPLTRAVYSYA